MFHTPAIVVLEQGHAEAERGTTAENAEAQAKEALPRGIFPGIFPWGLSTGLPPTYLRHSPAQQAATKANQTLDNGDRSGQPRQDRQRATEPPDFSRQ